MPESILRDMQCRSAKPRERVYRLSDGGGLALLVKPNGLKYWQFRYMKPGGREGLVQIGPYPRVSLEAARAARNEHRAAVQSGDDPATLRKQEKARRKVDAARSLTFKQCASAFIEARSAEWVNPKHTQQWTNTLATYAYPIIGGLRPCDIDTDLVRRVLEPIWLSKNETASRLRGRIENVLDWAKVRGLRDGENPARWSGHLDQLLAAPAKVQKPKHHTALPYTEIGAFIAELRTMVGTAAKALEFTIFTAMRTGEVIGAYPNELEMHTQTWTVPADRMKAKRPHRVPLSSSAIALIKSLPQVIGGPLFEGARERRPMSNMAMLKLLERMGHETLTVHGFRSTFRDWAAECTPFPNEVVEMASRILFATKQKVRTAVATYSRSDDFSCKRGRTTSSNKPGLWITLEPGPPNSIPFPASVRADSERP